MRVLSFDDNGAGSSGGLDNCSSIDNMKQNEPIAIVGAACRFAGEASSLPGLWNLMREKRTAHAKVPKSRWDADAWYHPDSDRKGTLNTTHGFFLEQDPGAFDAPFFSTSAKEAAGMDPAKRLLLEVAYEALENAGMPMENVAGSMTGCYVGSMTSDYELLSTQEIYDMPHMAGAGTSEAMTANRVSWFFDFRGPSLTLDTACSSSLYALHLACQSLRLGEIKMALVAGVNMILHPNFSVRLADMHMLSPDGFSHSFDDRANGYGRGEGIGSLIVKRLSDAIRDGDTIRAVIRGSSVNVDGKTPSVTMPSSEAQASLINMAYENAGLPLTETQYVELHGTGTPVGDPIELAAIANTFGAASSPESPVYVGSIKPNIGHTEGCAGLAGVFKAMMSLEKGIILPTAEIQNVNPKLRFADWNLALSHTVLPWPTKGRRRVSVNSFGFGGANAHVIMEDAYHYLKEHGLKGNHTTLVASEMVHKVEQAVANEQESVEENKCISKPLPQRLFVFSSRDEAGIKRIAQTLRAHCQSGNKSHQTSEYAANVAYTFANRRSLFDYRSFAVANTTTELAHSLGASLPKFRRQSKKSGLAFVFTGQGAQWAGMGSELVEFPIFASSIKRSKAILDAIGCPFDVEVELQNFKDSKIESSEYSQPICTVVQVALIDLLADWGVTPKAVVGHSSGEIAAAFAAGIITHEDAIKVAYLRGVYSGKASKGPKVGAMMAAGLSEDEAAEYLKAVPLETVVTACVNSPKSVTLSGDAEYVTQLESALQADGKFARKLRVVTAYHSPHMRTVADDCLEEMMQSGLGEPRTTSTLMFSSVTGGLINHKEVGKEYWVRNMCSPVRFSQAVSAMLTYSPNKRRGLRRMIVPFNSLIEVGPHAALKGPLTQIMEAVDRKLISELPYVSMLMRKEDAVSTALKAAGHLWALGVYISLSKVNREINQPGNIRLQHAIDLPAYPFNHDRMYWHESSAMKEQKLSHKPRTDLLGVAIVNQNVLEPQWNNFLRIRENPWIEDHKITGTTLYPGAGMLIMVIEAAREIARKDATLKGIEFKDIHFERGLVVPSEDAVETQLRLSPVDSDSRYTFAVFSRLGETAWIKHSYGSFTILYKEQAVGDTTDLAEHEWETFVHNAYEKIHHTPSKAVDVKKLYKSLYSVGMEYGPSFQNVTTLFASPDNNTCRGTVAIPDTKSIMPFGFEYPHLIHPATLDAIFHLAVVAVGGGPSLTEAAVPFMVERLFVSANVPQDVGSVFHGYSEKVVRKDQQPSADLFVADEAWREPMVIAQGLIMKQVTSGASGLSSSTQVVDKRTAEIVWKLDIEWISRRTTSPSQLSQISRLQDWLDLECHKSASPSILLVGNLLQPSILDEISPFITGKSLYRGFAKVTILVSEEALELWKAGTTTATQTIDFKLKSWDPAATDVSSLGSASYDLVLIGQAEETVLSSWKSLVRPGGRLLAFTDQEESAIDGFHVQFKDKQLTVVPQIQEVKIKHSNVCLLTPEYPAEYANLTATLQVELQQKGFSVRQVSLNNVTSIKEEYVISLIDLYITSTIGWDAEQFANFQKLIASTFHILWLTRGGQMQHLSNTGLSSAPIAGLFRVLRNEFPQVTFAHLDLSQTFDVAGPESAGFILDIWERLAGEANENWELELSEVDGQIMVPRLVAMPELDVEIALSTGSAPSVMKTLSSSGPLQLDTSHNLVWKTDDEAAAPLEADEVEIRVHNMSVDLSSFSFKVEQLGSQVTGQITRCGSNVTNFAPGDTVIALGNSPLRTHVRQHKSALMAFPKLCPRISTEAAATTYWLYAVAIYILKHTAKLKRNQHILIQDVASGLGQALVFMAQMYGANVFASVKTVAEKETLQHLLHVDKDHIVTLSSGTGAALKSFLMRQTNGECLDVVVGSGSNVDEADKLASCMSDFGHFVMVVDQITQVPSKLRANAHFSTIDPGDILREKPRLVAKLLADISQDFHNGQIIEIARRTNLSVSDLANTLSVLEKGHHSGILAVEFSGDAQVPVRPAPPPHLELDPSATYVLAGGLGALGLRIADLMARHGAKHITFLSRSGEGRYLEELAELSNNGCETTVLKCNIVSLESVQNAVAEVEKLGRPIRGVVQLAMVLQDSLFDKMTHDQWRIGFSPKVTGSWNLHTAFPTNMTFFIMLSSLVSIIGNMGQANYASANAYMDALAHYRRAQGLPGTTINAGLVTDSGHSIDGTNTADAVNRFTHLASMATNLEEMDIAMLASMRGTTAGGEEVPAQFMYTITDTLQPDGADPWARDSKFIHRWAVNNTPVEDVIMSAGEVLAAAASLSDATAVVGDMLKKILAPGLGVQPQDIDDERPLYDAGVDSLKAVEIRNKVFRELKSEISVFEILSPSSLVQISSMIVLRSKLVATGVKDGSAAE